MTAFDFDNIHNHFFGLVYDELKNHDGIRHYLYLKKIASLIKDDKKMRDYFLTYIKDLKAAIDFKVK